ncbi:protein-methionine-sulfoxide reductase catalytic subunit MsrP [Helicobacter apodemus]|uniref:Protein-methionine-sulfoxide reductase catalytic subunit MsrP n=1 Tax=Helicobacter apodemus TaxID=135569 RepID=A0A2U8FD84_9HELI|nr:protein-methionine-sulfoxide reductase catalytic subunit MsrP [Helicobacter apodemus]AWI34211.1 mononuclear molybdenum enzyme YedY [Helicobacter apodemus]TLE16821.1 protein-methionine-sulfoxide reductase catalytic subunit MsrP [Helicobacter apodemus]
MKELKYQAVTPKEYQKVTPEIFFKQRRRFLKLGAGSLVAALSVESLLADIVNKTDKLHYRPMSDKEMLKINRNVIFPTPEELATSYNNFYEFGYSKSDPKNKAGSLKTSPWSISIEGEVQKPFVIDVEELITKMTLVERIYRFRCVEAWSMVIPWIGFELREFINFAKPTKEAKYIRFTTLYDPKQFPMQGGFLGLGMGSSFLDFPYKEGLRIDEARNPLSMLAVGMYKKRLLPQNGAPIRLVVPWKYGYKMIKSINKIEFLKKQPVSTWEAENSREYGFYGNVDPEVSHPRWSQSSERVIGQRGRVPTLYLNGYAKEVEHLYAGLDRKKLY